MIRRETWLAVGLFALAVAAAFWWSQSDLPAGQAATPTPTEMALWQLSQTSVTRIQIEDAAEGTSVRARRDPDQIWVLEEPEAPLADIGRLERAVTSILVLRPLDSIEASDLADFGLAEPRHRIQLDLADGRRQTLEIGRAGPTGAVIYARLPYDNRVHFLSRANLGPVIELLELPPIATPSPSPTGTGPLPAMTP